MVQMNTEYCMDDASGHDRRGMTGEEVERRRGRKGDGIQMV